MRTRIIKSLAATVVWLLFAATGRELVLWARVCFGTVPENFVGLLIVRSSRSALHFRSGSHAETMSVNAT